MTNDLPAEINPNKLDDQSQLNDTYRKNVALSGVYGLSELSLRKQRAVNTIAHTVQEQFFLRNPELANADESISEIVTEEYVDKSGSMFEIPEETIMSAMGYTDKRKYYSYTQVLDLFREIADATIGFDALGVAKQFNEREEWTGFTKFIGSVERKKGYFKISMPPPMILKIVNPETSFQGTTDWTLYNSRNTPGIYETCQFYFERNQDVTPWFSVEEIRKLTGAKSKMYEEPKHLRSRVINVALNDINKQPLPLLIEVESGSFGEKLKEWERRKAAGQMPGRKPTTHYRFVIKEKTGSVINGNLLTDQIHLTSQKTELQSLGIAKNQIDGVLDECRDKHGNLEFRYLRWCIQKGHEMRRLSEHNKKSSEHFGGLFRKNIIRGKKSDWFAIDNMITGHLYEVDNKFDPSNQSDSKLIKSLFNKLQSNIVSEYISSLTEFGYAHLREEFDKFLLKEFPHKHKEMVVEKDISLEDMKVVSGHSYHFHLYLDLNTDLFKYESFAQAMRRHLESES